MSIERGGAVLITAAIIGVGLVFARGGFNDFSFADSVLVVVGGLAFAAVYFGAIHLLLKQWDRLRASLKRGRSIGQRDRPS